MQFQDNHNPYKKLRIGKHSNETELEEVGLENQGLTYAPDYSSNYASTNLYNSGLVLCDNHNMVLSIEGQNRLSISDDEIVFSLSDQEKIKITADGFYINDNKVNHNINENMEIFEKFKEFFKLIGI